MGIVNWWRHVVSRDGQTFPRKNFSAKRFRHPSVSVWLERLEDRTLLNAGGMDPTFGAGGLVVQNFSPSDHVYGVARQSDGKYVVVGDTGDGVTQQMLVARFNANGTLDDGFGAGGMFQMGFGWDSTGFARSVAIQRDGEIVVAGYYTEGGLNHLALLRLDTYGNLDPSFNFGGTVTNQVDGADYYRSVVVQPDGKIIAAGASGLAYDAHTVFTVVRYNSNGTLDSSFGSGGVVRKDLGSGDAAANDIALQGDGKIVVVGHSSTMVDNFHFVTFRFNSNGTPDTTFSGGGEIENMPGGLGGASYEDLTAVVIQANGKIVVAG